MPERVWQELAKGLMAAKQYALWGEMLIANSFTCSSSVSVVACIFIMQHIPRETATFEGQLGPEGVGRGA